MKYSVIEWCKDMQNQLKVASLMILAKKWIMKDFLIQFIKTPEILRTKFLGWRKESIKMTQSSEDSIYKFNSWKMKLLTLKKF